MINPPISESNIEAPMSSGPRMGRVASVVTGKLNVPVAVKFLNQPSPQVLEAFPSPPSPPPLGTICLVAMLITIDRDYYTKKR
jgi:hypothetical protein